MDNVGPVIPVLLDHNLPLKSSISPGLLHNALLFPSILPQNGLPFGPLIASSSISIASPIHRHPLAAHE